MKKLAVIVSHPIQYYAPLFKLLAERCHLRVFYSWGRKGHENKIDKDFGKNINWDIPLLDGYDYEFLENTAKKPGSHHFKGIKNPSIIKKIQAFKPDFLLVYGWSYISHLKVLRHFKGRTPIWFRGDSTLLDEETGLKKIIRNIFLRWVYSHIDKALYVGTANKAYFKAFGLKEKQLVFAPHAVDNERFDENRKLEADEFRAKLNIKPEDVLILFAGKLEPKKNPELLLRAFLGLKGSKEQGVRNKEQETRSIDQRLKTKHQSDLLPPLLYSKKKPIPPDDILKTRNEQLVTENTSSSEHGRRTEVHLLFVGSGVLESSLKSQVSNLKSNYIHFLDFQNQSQMPVIYQACDLFCLPSKGPGETWGLAVNEAMAAGKAVLVSDKAGCAQDLVSKNNGQIFKAGNIEDLSKRLQDLTNNKNRLKQIGLKSKQTIQNWSFAVQISQFLKLIDAAE